MRILEQRLARAAGLALGLAARLAAAAALPLAGMTGVARVTPAAAQEMTRCAPEARVLTGDWTTTETIDGQNSSFWRGSLHIVHRGAEVAGRWEPPDGEPERAVLGTFAAGVLRLTVRGTPAQPAAAVVAAPERTWLLTTSTDGTLLTGRWSEPPSPGTAQPRSGALVATGEAGCLSAGGPSSSSSGSTRSTPLTASTPPPASTPSPQPVGTGAPCAGWDVSGTWAAAAAGDGSWRLRLWQDGQTVLGWYEPVETPGAGTAGTAWVVDGTLRGRTLLLQHYLGDSATVARTLVLAADGTALSGAWPLPFGPDETETLAGQARCAG